MIFEFSLILFLLPVIMYFNFKLRKQIANYTGLVDKPDNIRKTHTIITPLIGSFPLVITFIIYSIIIKSDEILFYEITLISLIFFIIGLIDDKIQINYFSKFVIFIFTLVIVLSVKPQFLISKIYFETFDLNFFLVKEHSYILTIICIIILINTFNFTDGINGLSSFIAIAWLLALLAIGNSFHNELIFLILCIFLNSFPILRGKYFIGDSGTLFIGSLISLITISIFNQNSDLISYEQIFLIFMIPGLDLIRLIIIRTKNKKNPFLPDRKHLHHFLINKFSLNKSICIYFCMMAIPFLLFKIMILSIEISILVGLIFYISVIFLIKKI